MCVRKIIGMCVDRDGPRRADLNGGRGGGGGCGAHHSMSQEGNSRGTSEGDVPLRSEEGYSPKRWLW